ncbi:Uncharacterized protein DBV15_08254 [Temnothorax longispinosus]|uniref:Uncharacterized protein n=1 Tax=Temnothorax longispinosus TaxID=300112 RepID=A0A4S2KIS1_9HYME|nr:Uncharacterized protein DBV15_08254 [Temnothorax longispinosus]
MKYLKVQALRFPEFWDNLRILYMDLAILVESSAFKIQDLVQSRSRNRVLRNETAGRIDALKYTVGTRIHACVNSARGKIIIILRKQSTLIRSFARSQILCARDNYANTLPRWLVPRADNDKTQILTPTALKRENKATVIHGGQPPRGGSIDPPPDTETSHPPIPPGQLQPSCTLQALPHANNPYVSPG